MSMTITRAAMTAQAALSQLPKQCTYHGENIEGRDLWRYAGACCATGQPSLMRQRAETALESLRRCAEGHPVASGVAETPQQKEVE